MHGPGGQPARHEEGNQGKPYLELEGRSRVWQGFSMAKPGGRSPEARRRRHRRWRQDSDNRASGVARAIREQGGLQAVGGRRALRRLRREYGDRARNTDWWDLPFEEQKHQRTVLATRFRERLLHLRGQNGLESPRADRALDAIYNGISWDRFTSYQERRAYVDRLVRYVADRV